MPFPQTVPFLRIDLNSLPLAMGTLGSVAGPIAGRFGSRSALICGTGISALAFAYASFAHNHPYNMLITVTLLGVKLRLTLLPPRVTVCVMGAGRPGPLAVTV